MMKNYKKILLILGIFFLIAGLASTLKLISRPLKLQPKAEGSSPPPTKVKISNLTPEGFTVTWVTKDKSTGFVIFSKDKEILEKNETISPRAGDERGDSTKSFVHSVKIYGLEARQKYYFKIRSDDKYYLKNLAEDWQEGGIAESVTLPELDYLLSLPPSANNSPGTYSQENAAFNACPQLPGNTFRSCFRPNVIFGQVFNEDGQKTAEGIVYLEIPGKSNLLSVIVNSEGKWAIDIANFMKSDFSDRLSYLPNTDLVKIMAQGAEGREVALYRSIPFVAQVLPNQTNPVPLKLLTFPAGLTQSPTITNTPTPLPTATTKPITSIQPLTYLTFSIKLDSFLGKKSPRTANLDFQYQGEKKQTQKVTLTQVKEIYESKVPFYKTGELIFWLKTNGYLRREIGGLFIDKETSLYDATLFPLLPGDADNNNVINILDLALVLSEIKQRKTTGLINDYNGDGLVDLKDLAILINNYRKMGD
ncbi:MAG: fibronectin type III domain-containing protein [Patescibacteria group bacterium]|nr:fibronectin type III domain-containing protein [Patescibacteria group bacterium]